MTNTIFFLAVMASFIGYFIWKQTDSKKSRRVWKIVEDTPISEQNIKDTLAKSGATDFTEDTEDGGLFFTYQDERYGIHYPQLPAVNLSICRVLEDQMDLELCQQAAISFNEEINGAHAAINPETRQIAFVLYSIAPTCHILLEILPYMAQALKTARQLYMEIYWTQLYQKTIKTTDQ